MPDLNSLPVSKLADRYEFIAQIGRGGMGSVYKAHDNILDRSVAIKLITSEDKGFFEVNEAKVLAKINHPCVVQVYDFVELDDKKFIIMEYMEGGNLKNYLTAHPNIDIEIFLSIAIDITMGIMIAHDRGIIHCDLKVENILIGEKGQFKVGDFGIAKEAGKTFAIENEKKITGSYLSMSPEQVLGKNLDFRSDVFSVGVMFYKMLSGTYPFEEGGNKNEVLEKIVSFPHVALKEVDQCIPSEISDLVDRMLVKDRLLRLQSMNDVLSQLHNIQNARSKMELDTIYDQTIDDKFPSDEIKHSEIKKRIDFYLIGSLLLIIVMVVVFFQLNTFKEKNLYVAIASPEVLFSVSDNNSTALPQIERLRELVLHAVTDSLLERKNLVVIGEDAVVQVDGGANEVMRALGAEIYLKSRLVCDGDEGCQLSLRSNSSVHGGLNKLKRYHIDVSNLNYASSAIAGFVAGFFEEYPKNENSFSWTTDETVLNKYLNIKSRINKVAVNLQSVVDQTQSLLEEDSDFFPAHLLLARLLVARYHETFDQIYLDKAENNLLFLRRRLPENTLILSRLFKIALIRNDMEKAQKWINLLKNNNPLSETIYSSEAELNCAMGKYKESVEKYDASISIRKSWDKFYDKASCLLDWGKPGEAMLALEQSLRINPKSNIISEFLASVASYQGQFKRSVELLTQLIEHNEEPNKYAVLSSNFTFLGEYEEALKYGEKALELAPQNIIALLAVADASKLSGNFHKSNSFYNAIVSRYSNSNDKYAKQAVALSLAHLREKENAVELTQELVRQHPGDAQIQYSASTVYCLVGDISSYRVAYKKAKELGIHDSWYNLPWFSTCY